MIFWIYDMIEKEYHELDQSTCECKPEVKFLDNGDMLIIHNRLSEENTNHRPEIIKEAISMILERNA